MEEEIKKGRFVVGKCNKCEKIVWPPSDYCSKCFGKITAIDGPPEGTVLEYSIKDEECFCLAKFEKDVKIIGKISQGIPKENQKIKIKKCGIKNGNYFFEFSIIN